MQTHTVQIYAHTYKGITYMHRGISYTYASTYYNGERILYYIHPGTKNTEASYSLCLQLRHYSQPSLLPGDNMLVQFPYKY